MPLLDIFVEGQYHLTIIGNAGLGGAGLLCALHPYFTLSFGYLLGMTSLLGITCGTAFGSSYHLVSHFSQRCQTALTTGALKLLTPFWILIHASLTSCERKKFAKIWVICRMATHFVIHTNDLSSNHEASMLSVHEANMLSVHSCSLFTLTIWTIETPETLDSLPGWSEISLTSTLKRWPL